MSVVEPQPRGGAQRGSVAAAATPNAAAEQVVDTRAAAVRRSLAARVPWRPLLALLVTAGVVFGLVQWVASPRELATQLANARWELLPLALLMTAINPLLSAWRWDAVLRAMGRPVGLRAAVAACMAAWPLSVVSPSRAGDLARAVFVTDRVPLTEGIGSAIAEKAIDAHSLCLLAALGGWVSGHAAVGWAGLAGAVVLWFAVGALALLHALATGRTAADPGPWGLGVVVDRFGQGLAAFRGLVRAPGLTALAIAVSLAAFVNATALAGVLLHMTRATVSWRELAWAWPLATFASVLPLTLGGIGTRDATFVALLHGAAVAEGRTPPAPGPIVLATLLFAGLTAWLTALAGLPWLARSRTPAPPPTATPADGCVPVRPAPAWPSAQGTRDAAAVHSDASSDQIS